MKAIATTTSILVFLIVPISICSNNLVPSALISQEKAEYKQEKQKDGQGIEGDKILQHIAQNFKHAQETERQCGVPACISLAQSIIESGAGQSELGKLNNLFGHRSFPRDEKHYYKGREINGWRTYDSHSQAYEEHGRFYHHTRQWDSTQAKFNYPYRHLLGKDWKVWTNGSLNQYAGNRNYCKKIEEIIRKYSLDSYNLQQQQ